MYLNIQGNSKTNDALSISLHCHVIDIYVNLPEIGKVLVEASTVMCLESGGG